MQHGHRDMSAPQLFIASNTDPVSPDNLNTYQLTCNNVADLKAFPGIDGIQVWMRGYVTTSDGGQGVFYWNSSGTGPDDGGITSIVPNGVTAGCWSRQTIIAQTEPIVTGQCQLRYTSSNAITLAPYNGNKIYINGVLYDVPDAGITLAPTSLTPGTLYYIYVSQASSVLSLAASATAPAVEAGTGFQIKTGDPDSVLVGMVYPVTGPLWASSSTQRFVRSWYNDAGIVASNYYSGNKTTTSTSFTELDSGTRVEFLAWDGEQVLVTTNVQLTNSGSFVSTHTMIGVSDTSGADPRNKQIATTPASVTDYRVSPVNCSFVNVGSIYNFIALLGKVDSGTGTWLGANQNTGIQVTTVRK